jgi:ABC-type uncharacterized transport system substrate-binding protein
MRTPIGTSRFEHAQRWSIVVLLLVFALAVPATRGEAEELLIVLSSQSSPYRKAAQACQSELKSAGIDSDLIDLKELTAEQIKGIDTRVIAVGGRAAARLAHDLSSQVGLFYCMTPNPAKIGLTVRANTTGISTEAELIEQVRLIQSSNIEIKRIGMLYRSKSKSSSMMIEKIRAVLPTSWELVTIDLDSTKSESEGIKDLLKKKIDLVWTVPDPAVFNSSTIKALLIDSLRKEVPVFGFSHSFVRAGAVFGIGIDPKDQGVDIALLLLDGASDQHRQAELHYAVNLIVAGRIKIRLPGFFVDQAQTVYRPEKGS